MLSSSFQISECINANNREYIVFAVRLDQETSGTVHSINLL
jgi:hypothetical protein